MKSWVQQYFGDNDVDLVLRPVPPASAEPLKSELSAKGNNDQEFYLCSFRSLEGSNIYPLREILQRPYEIWLERNDQRIPTGFTIRGAFLFHFDAFPETLYAGFKYNTFQIIGKGINLNCNWTAGTSSELIGSTDGKVIPLKPEVFEEPRSLRGTITLQTGGSSGGSVNLSAKITKILSPIEPHYSDEVELTTAETMLFGIVNEPKGVRAYDFPIVIKVEDSAGNDVTHAFTIRCDDSTGIYFTPKVSMNHKQLNFFFYFDSNGSLILFDQHTLTVTADVPEGPPKPATSHAVTPLAAKTVLAAGESVQLYVPGETISNAFSSNPAVAFATGDGRVIGIAPGTATIEVRTGEGGTGSVMVTVIQSTGAAYAESSPLMKGETTRIRMADGTPVTRLWTDNSRILRVNADGTVTGLSAGTAKVFVTGGDTGAVVELTVVEGVTLGGKKTIRAGETAQLTLPEGEAISVVQSSDPSVLTVEPDGAYTGQKPGAATITVLTKSGRRGQLAVTVTDKPSYERTLKVGQTLTLKVKGRKIVSAELEEDNGAIAVANSGRITALSAGSDTVILTTEDGKTLRVTVTVTERAGKVSLKSGSLRLRKSPNGATLLYLKNGQTVTILAVEDGFYKVEVAIDGKAVTGYVSKSYIKK